MQFFRQTQVRTTVGEGGLGKYIRRIVGPICYRPADGRVAGTFCLAEPGQLSLNFSNQVTVQALSGHA